MSHANTIFIAIVSNSLMSLIHSWAFIPLDAGDLHSAVAPMCFQTSIPHKPRQVRWCEVHASVVTEWPPTCLHKLLPRGHKTATKKNLKWKKSQLNLYLSYKSHSSFKPIWIFSMILCVSFKWYFWQKPTAPQQIVWKFQLDLQYNIFHWGSTILGVSTLWTDYVLTLLHIITLYRVSDMSFAESNTLLEPTQGNAYENVFSQKGRLQKGQPFYLDLMLTCIFRISYRSAKQIGRCICINSPMPHQIYFRVK